MPLNSNIERMHYLSSQLADNERIRNSLLNLVVSENVLSPLVRSALSTDLAGRYSSEFYGGSSITRNIIDYVRELAKELFNCEFACVTPISGNICDVAAINSLTSINDVVALIDMETGGYPFEIKAFNRKATFLPFDKEKWNLDYERIEEFFVSNRPVLTILGASAILYPYSITRVLKNIDNEAQCVVYDGSHVLGLIAGKKFQNPLEDGIPLLFGSTHKTFPGPQGGIILGNDSTVFDLVTTQFSIQTSEHPFGKHHGTILVDNVHANRIAALGFALLEMLEFGNDYATQIVRNSKSLGEALSQYGLPILKTDEFGFTQSHQLLLPFNTSEGLSFKRKLEKAGIFVDAFVRIGTAEISRRGLKEEHMKVIAEFISDVIIEGKDPELVKKQVQDFCQNFQELQFCFTDYKDII